MKTDWFTPKLHGYGAAPKSRKGWADILALIAMQLGLTAGLMGVGGAAAVEPWRLGAWLVTAAGLAIGCIVLSRARTDGEWRWPNNKKPAETISKPGELCSSAS